uniref:Uncharacterized protein n=1 Tax=Arundo donax TaxID=35708 RepID=A0A0A8ZSY1_ARUDO
MITCSLITLGFDHIVILRHPSANRNPICYIFYCI